MEGTQWFSYSGLRRRFSPEILSPDLEQSLLEKTSTSLVYPLDLSTHDTVIKVLPRPLCGPNGPGSSHLFLSFITAAPITKLCAWGDKGS